MSVLWKVTSAIAATSVIFTAAFAEETAIPGVPAKITSDSIVVRTGPGSSYDRRTMLDSGAPVTLLSTDGSWAQIKLSSGATGWVASKYVQAKPTPVKQKPVAPTQPAILAKPSPIADSTTKPAATIAAPATIKSTPKPAQNLTDVPGRVETDVLGALSGTKPDILSGAKDSPAASAGDSFRVLVVLLPVLGGIVLAIRGLKAVQQRTGSLPDMRAGIKGVILGGFNLNNARKTGGSSLRVIESIPLGTSSLHLIDARGRILLLGVSGGNLTTLADLSDTSRRAEPAGESDFRSILNNMSEDLVEDYSQIRGDLGSVVGSLDDQIRAARESIARTAVRSRK